MKTFFYKVKHFFKRNIYPITVSLCTVLVLGIIAISAYTSIKNSNQVVDTNVPQDNVNNVDDGEEKKPDASTPSGSEDVVIFELPFDGATVSKQYCENALLYDKTTTYWETHQGLDFACTAGTVARAVYDGEIIKIDNSMMNSTIVYLKVSDNLVAVYKGLSSELKVKEGDKVKKGQELGQITGFLTEYADGVHLHLELMKGDILIDPTDYFSFNK